MLDLLYNLYENNQPVFTNPQIKIEKNKRAPLFDASGLTLIRNLIIKLNIEKEINNHLHILKRHKPYFESDHILNFVYNFLSGHDTINDIETLQNDKAFLNILGTESIPDPTTAGDFLARFDLTEIETLQEIMDTIQDNALSLLSKKKMETATVDADSSIHQVYGDKKEGAEYAYTGVYSYNAYYITLMELGDILYSDLREGNTHSSNGTTKVLPGIIDRLRKQFKRIRFRGDSAFYDKNITRILADKGAEFFIVADQTTRLLNTMLEQKETDWLPFDTEKSQKSGKKSRKKRKNNKKIINHRYNRKSRTKFGEVEISSFNYRPVNWDKDYRVVVKRTLIKEDNNQQYFDESLCKYQYYMVITNSNMSDAEVMRTMQGRGNQENFIKDIKYGLGLSHIPTGFFNANKVYFKIAALAWNLKTWFLNLIKMGKGAIVRFKRFLVEWIYHACMVSVRGKNRIVLRFDEGEYLYRFEGALKLVT